MEVAAALSDLKRSGTCEVFKSSRNIAKQACKRKKRNELKTNFQLLLGYKQGNKSNHCTVQCAFVLNVLYQCIRNMYCNAFEMDPLC